MKTASDWPRSFAVGGLNVSRVGHLTFADRRRDWQLHLRHRSLDRCDQRMASECLHPTALVVGTRP
jgi:hypothetical protein